MKKVLGGLIAALLLASGLTVVGATMATRANAATPPFTQCYVTYSRSCVSSWGYTGQSTWGYPVDSWGNNCTNYVAFRLSKSGYLNPGNLGNAGDWDVNARAKGLTVTPASGHVPQVGDVAQWNYGHVAFIEWVSPDGSQFAVSETGYNLPPYASMSGRGIFGGGGKHNESAWPDNFIRFKKATFKTAPTPTISGTAAVGNTLTAKTGTWNPVPSFKYQWQRNQGNISGATGSTYKLTTADAGQKIRVVVTGSKSGYVTTTKYSGEVTVPWLAYVSEGTATTSASGVRPEVGYTFTASPGSWNPTPSFTYQWKRNGAAIAGATAPTYKSIAADAGTDITVDVTATKAGYQTRVRTPAATRVIGTNNGGLELRQASSGKCVDVVGGRAANGSKVGIWPCYAGDSMQAWRYSSQTQQLTVYGSPQKCMDSTASHATSGTAVGVWDCGAQAQLKWTLQTDGSIRNVDGLCLDTAGASTADLAQLIVATCNGSASQKFAMVPTGDVGITGVARVGGALAAKGTWYGDTTLSYQWKRSGSAIPGATGVRYVPTAADYGHQISVAVTGNEKGIVVTTVASAGVSPGLGTMSGIRARITGKLKVGKKLTASVSPWPSGTAVRYQWFASGKKILGATRSTLKLTKKLAGKRIKVTIIGRNYAYIAHEVTASRSGKVRR